jgi:ABC-2 type transport system permease protein
LNNTTAVAWKEIKAYFQTPTAYVVGAMFLILTGIFFVLDATGAFAQASVTGFVVRATNFSILLAPLLTMRLLSEEQKLGTMELLLTAPIRDWEVVVGKFLAAFTALMSTYALTLYYVVLLYWFGNPDTGPVFSAYLGLILYGMTALAIGIFASSLSSNQLVAGVVGFVIVLLLSFINLLGDRLPGAVELFNNLSMNIHFGDFTRGVLDTTHIAYYIAMTAVFLFLAVRSLESRRWR